MKEEKNIRRYLVEKNMVESVILCPDKMFEKTSIATCIVVFNKNKKITNISFVDMRQCFLEENRKQRGQFGGASHENRTYQKNIKIFTEEQMQKAIDGIENQSDILGFSKTVSIKMVADNEFSLSPAKYIEIEGCEFRHREYGEIIDDLNRVIVEKNGLKLTINESLAKTIGIYDIFKMFKESEDNTKQISKVLEFTGKKIEKENFIAMSKKAGELKFENGSKERISTILLSILQMWKQHIMYLNNEENRYLIELRDALLPDLMSGKIDVDDLQRCCRSEEG